MAFQPPLEEVPQLAAGALMLMGAATLLLLDFRGRMNRALALYLSVSGVRDVLGALDDPAKAPILTSFVFGTIPWFDIAIPFAAVFVALRYRERGSAVRTPRWALGALLLACLVAEGLYLWRDPGPTRADEGYATYVGHPAILAYAALPSVLGWLAVGFARGSRTLLDEAQARAYRLAALAFAIAPAFAPVIAYRYFFLIGEPQPAYLLVTLAALVPVAIVAWTLASVSRRSAAVLGGVAVLASALVAWERVGSTPVWSFQLVDGTVRLALPALLLYSILRHRLFDIDMRIRWTISRSALAFAFVFVFFVTAEVAQAFLAESLGWAVGGVATGLLVFALAPLQRLAERVGRAAMPQARPAATMTDDEREEVFRGVVRDAWADGALERSERRLLETMRARLGIPHDRAAQLELEVTSER